MLSVTIKITSSLISESRLNFLQFSKTTKGFEVSKMFQCVFEVAEDNKNEDTHVLPPNYEDQLKNLSSLSHLNVRDDHVAIKEHNYDLQGHDRVIFVHVKLNGNTLCAFGVRLTIPIFEPKFPQSARLEKYHGKID